MEGFILQQIIQGDFLTVFYLGLAINLSILCVSFLCYFLLNSLLKTTDIQFETQRVTLEDFTVVILVVLCNTLLFNLTTYLIKNNWVSFHHAPNWWNWLTHSLFLIIIMDLLMYLTHRLAHQKTFYTLVHKKHHSHKSVNCLSLFVLSPFEAIGFGFLIIAILVIVNLNIYAVITYGLINVIWGTVGHVNKVMINSKWIALSDFHNTHHLKENCNYGFYTTLWDKLFNSIGG
ncbi:sterol desaturase family protein [Myroides sp. LJL119]